MLDHPIRVLHIVNQMNRAGMENRLMDIYRHIDRKRVQFDFYTCSFSQGYYDNEIKLLGGRIFYSEPLDIKKILFLARRFRKFFQQHPEYKIVHCHMNQWCGLILLGALRAKVPVRIAHSRTALEKENFNNIIKNIIKLPVNYSATHKFAVSRKAGIWLFGKKRTMLNEVKVFPNAISCDDFIFSKENREKYRSLLNLSNEYVIMHVGNFKFEKNHTFILDIFADLCEVYQNLKLILVGDGILKDAIKKKCDKLNITENVILTGSRNDVAQLLSAADCFIFPSLYEGFPGAVLEAEAAGLPCIISNRISQEVVLLDTTISLPIQEGTKLWVKNIIYYMKHKLTVNKRIEANRIVKSKGYDITSLCKKYEDFYSVCEGNRVF